MTVETINVKGNANKVLEEHHRRLKSEAKELNDELHTAKPKKKCQIIAIYGKGGIGKSFTLANLSFPTEFLSQQQSLIQNIQGYERDFAEKLAKTMITISMEYGFPMQGLQQQKAKNQSGTTQQIIFSIAGAINDPNKATEIIRNMLNESVKCRAHQSNYDYE